VTQRPVLPSAVPDAAAPAPVTTTAPVTTPVLVAQVVGEGAPTPAQPAHTAPAPAALDAPGHVERTETASHGTAVRAGTPAAENAPRPDGVGHAVPEAAHDAVDGIGPATPVDVPPAAPTQVVEAAPVTATAAPSAPARPDAAPATTTTHHVRPALVEAARGLRHEGGGRTSLVVRLDPPELGAVLVRLTVQDGRVDVTLRTPDLAARADLQAQSYDIEQVLRDQGFDLASFDVLHGDVLSGGHGDAPDRGTPDRSRRADGHPAHPPVTDDGPAPEPDGTWL
jgi:chemotaxis protein MotD